MALSHPFDNTSTNFGHVTVMGVSNGLLTLAHESSEDVATAHFTLLCTDHKLNDILTKATNSVHLQI